jgi:hypothetical protein
VGGRVDRVDALPTDRCGDRLQDREVPEVAGALSLRRTCRARLRARHSGAFAGTPVSEVELRVPGVR